MGACLRVEDPAEGIRILTLCNEAKRNAVDASLLLGMVRACEEAEADDVRCLILIGSGEKAFCAGYDLRELSAFGGEEALPDELLQRALAAMEQARFPIVAAIGGVAYGAGAELAAACDLRIADETARFAMPPARLGIVYAPAGLQRFVELVGLSQAKQLFYTGDPVDAARALSIGLVDEVVPEGQALTRARAIAERIGKNAPLAVQGMKRAFSWMRRRELPPEGRGEMEALRRASFVSDDAREGIAAVLEKREPRFRGR